MTNKKILIEITPENMEKLNKLKEYNSMSYKSIINILIKKYKKNDII